MKSIWKDAIKQVLPFKPTIVKRDKHYYFLGSRRIPDYYADGLLIWDKNTDFLSDPKFRNAYQLGMESGHKIGRPKGSSEDIHIEFRVYVCCWAAFHAARLPGDFVECGVNTGIYSLAVCKLIDFNSLDKSFFLFDTFTGIPEEQMLDTERVNRLAENESRYEECYELAKNSFSEYRRAQLVRGVVPESLDDVSIDKVCYLSIDMNIAYPEVAAIEFFWDKLVPGAPVVLDDYGWTNNIEQKRAMDAFAAKKGVMILTMPTGQGLLIKS